MRGLILIFATLLGACATSAAPINAPLSAERAQPPEQNVESEDVIVLALSGGGARAASFHLGVLQALRDMRGRDGRPLTEHIALISAVSGGAILSAYYGLHGDPGLDSFRSAYLDKHWSLHSAGSPSAWFGATRGGMNAGGARWLDRELYHGARFRDLTRGPRIIINATDLYNSTPFAFTPLFFDAICSDLLDVRIADAVAASMAVPVAFRPVLAESYPDACAGPPAWATRVAADRAAPENVRQTARAFLNYRGDTRAQQRFLHLSDGGVADNLGTLSLSVMRVAGPAPAPLTHSEAVSARRVTVLVVNAEYIRPRTFQQHGADAIGAYEMLYSPLDVATDVAKRAALDAFRASLPEYERELRTYRCGLPVNARSGAQRCDDIAVSMDMLSLRDMTPDAYDALYDTPTDVSLPPETVTALIAGGRYAAEQNAMIAALRAN